MIILVDMDDTIEHLLKAWVNGVNEKYDRCVSCDEIISWDVSAAFPGLTHEQVYEIPMKPGFWKTVEPIEDNIFLFLGAQTAPVEKNLSSGVLFHLLIRRRFALSAVSSGTYAG